MGRLMSFARPRWVQTPIAPRANTTTRRTGLVTPIALGRPKAAVIGTGRVDGIPVYGLTTVVVTDYTDPGLGLINVAHVPLPEPTTVATVSVGYLLAKDYFRRGYELIRLEANGEVIFDPENGAAPKAGFRFYNGLQTTVDPITTEVVGPDAGAHTGDVLLFLPDYPSLQAPTITAVISNAATATGGTTEIEWTGTEPSIDFVNTLGRGSAYDPNDGLIYQLLTSHEIPGLEAVYLAVLDINTNREIYRLPLQDTAAYAGDYQDVWALRGSGHVVVRLRIPANNDNGVHRAYNASSGAIVAEYQNSGSSDEWVRWLRSGQFGGKYVLVGFNEGPFASPEATYFAEIDLSAGAFTVTRDDTIELRAIVPGPVTASSISFFGNTGTVASESVYAISFDGDSWSLDEFYTSPQNVSGMRYDPQTQYLVLASYSPSPTLRYVDALTGTLIDSFAADYVFKTEGFGPAVGLERLWPRPGFALFQRLNSGEFYLLDIAAKSTTLFASVPFDSEVGNNAWTGIFDQSRLAYFYAFGDEIWTEYEIPGAVPGQITLESHITDMLVDLGPYTIDQIQFIGFDGLSDWGDVIDKSGANIRALLRSYQDPLGFVWTDIGSKIVFRKTPTDGSFSADLTVADSDLVFKKGGSINSDDASDISRVTKVSLEYTSKDDNYQPRTVTADAYSALYEVTRSGKEAKFSTSLTLSDTDGERLVNEILLNLQAKDRTHAFSAYGEFAKMIPGDVVSVASGDISYSVELTKVNIRENMVIEFEARDFQTSLAADVAAVTNSGFSGISTITVQSQYIHLDLPLLRYSDDAGGAGIVQYGVVASRGQANWGGGSLYSGDTASELAVEYDQAAHGGVIGVCVDALANPLDPFSTADDSTLTIRKISGDATLLVDRTEDEVLAGHNLAFVGSAGRWEGVGFKTVTANGDGTYTLSGFAVRGYRGTEVFAPVHQAGDIFVLISAEWVESVMHPAADLNSTKFYKAVGFGQSPAATVAASHVLRGAAETPYAAVNLNAALGTPDGIDLSCDYRSRLATGLNPANFGEAELAFEWDIMDGSTVVRTLESTAGAVHYDDADVIADFGSYPAGIVFRVYMISALVGRGYRAQAGIPLDYEPTFDSEVWSLDTNFVTFDQE